MTEKERLFRAMRRETVDRPPWICPGGMMNLVTQDMMDVVDACWPEAHTSPEKMARLSAAAYETGCFENYGLPFCMTIEVEGMGAKVDMGSREHEPHVVEYPICSVGEWRTLKHFDCESGRAKTVLDAICLLKNKGTEVPIIGNLTGPVSVASSLLEPTTYYKELHKKKDEAHAFMGFVTDSIISFGLRQLEAGADIIAISDPSGTGEILGPTLFEEYSLPYINRIISALKENHPFCEVLVHICGKMHSVYTQLNGIRCNTISFDSLVNLKEAHDKLPDKALMGNLSTYTLEFAQPAKVRDMACRCLQSGANILSPACGLGSGSPMANLRAALSVVRGAGATR